MSFSLQRWLMVFHGSLSDNKSPQLFRTLLSILADLNKAVLWMVSACPIFDSFSPLTKPLRVVITVIIITSFAHQF